MMHVVQASLRPRPALLLTLALAVLVSAPPANCGGVSDATGQTQAATAVPSMSGLPQGIATESSSPIAPGSELTLKQAISISLQYHPKLREAAANTDAAKNRIGEARSFLGPQVFGIAQDLGSTDNGIGNTSYYNPGGIFPRMTGHNHDLPGNDFNQSWDTANNYMGGVAVSQFLFDFGRRRGFVSQRKFEAAALSAEQQLTELRLIFEVSQRYFDVLRAKQLIRVYQKAVEQRQYHLHEATVKAGAGLRPQLDVYVTEAEVQRAQLNLVDAQNAYRVAKVALNNALGLSDRAPKYHLADVLSYSPVTEKIEPLLAEALRERPDLKALEKRAQALGAQVAEYKSDYYPTVSAVGGYSAMSTGLPAVNNYNVGLLITWPLFEQLARR